MIVRTTRSVVAAAVVLGISLVGVLVVGPALAKDCQYGTPGCPYPQFACKSGEKLYNFGIHNGRLVAGCFPACDDVKLCNTQGPNGTVFYACCIRRGTLLPNGIVKKPELDITIGCGKGMYKGGDGKCYPKLN